MLKCLDVELLFLYILEGKTEIHGSLKIVVSFVTFE